MNTPQINPKSRTQIAAQIIIDYVSENEGAKFKDIFAALQKHSEFSRVTAFNAIYFLERSKQLYGNKLPHENIRYYASETIGDGYCRKFVAAGSCKLPVKLRGPALTPMAWVARQLGVV